MNIKWFIYLNGGEVTPGEMGWWPVEPWVLQSLREALGSMRGGKETLGWIQEPCDMACLWLHSPLMAKLPEQSFSKLSHPSAPNY